jgi:hypothetical protein
MRLSGPSSCNTGGIGLTRLNFAATEVLEMLKKKSLLGATGLTIAIGVILQMAYGPSILRVPGVIVVILLTSIAIISIPWKTLAKLMKDSWVFPSQRKPRNTRRRKKKILVE